MSYNGPLPTFTKKVLPKFQNGHWQFDRQMGGPEYVGFIYIVYDKVLKRAYIGKKLFYGTGQVNKGVESNWRSYRTSSKTLAEHFKHRPMSEFEFICVEQYKTKGGLSYAETWSLCHVEAPTTKAFYNTLIEKVTWNVKEPISDTHRKALTTILDKVKDYVS